MALRSDLGLEGDYSVPPPPRRAHMTDGTIDSNLVVILAALLCVLICALGLNSIFRCALRCSRRMVFESADDAAVRLANTGLSIKAIKALPVVVYSSANTVPPLPAEASTECPICLSEFANGEELRVFPKCNHGFHLGCIDTWLSSHSSCPTCRRSLAHVYKSDCTAVRIVVEQPGTASSGSMPV